MSNAPSLEEVLDAAPIERIEIELMPNHQFRWKLWSEGKIAYIANGKGVKSEIESMIESTKLISFVTLGVPFNE